jgi:uncharacterized membrane protein
VSDARAASKTYLPLTWALLIASTGCLLMIVVRLMLTGSLRYGFLLWNLFLAWIPYLLVLLILRITIPGTSPPKLRPGAVLLGLLWLLFYPNAPYILTDFIHVIDDTGYLTLNHPLLSGKALLWYDIILNAAFAFIGHFIGLISLAILHQTVERLYRRVLAWLVVVLACGLGGYGIYLGRFERLNSWDILFVPVATLRIGILNLFNLKALLFSICFAFYIFLTYLVVHFFRRAR